MRIPKNVIVVFLSILLLIVVKVKCQVSIGRDEGQVSTDRDQERSNPYQTGLNNDNDEEDEYEKSRAGRGPNGDVSSDDDDDQGQETTSDSIQRHLSSNVVFAADNKKEVQEGRLYRVVKAAEGGWITSNVGAPFDIGAAVKCHKDAVVCSSGEGVDWLSKQRTLECTVEVADTSRIRVKCEGEEKSKLLSDDCCERWVNEDTSVYATAPQGLIHYATWGYTEPVTIATGMNIVEQTYEAELKRRYGNQPVLFLYFADWDYDEKQNKYLVDHNIPRRVEQSSFYKGPFHRTLIRQQTDPIADNWQLAKRVKAMGMNVKGGPFPVTFLSLLEALDAVQEPTAQFYINSIKDKYGMAGVHIWNRELLYEMWEKRAVIQGDQVVIREIIPDFSQILNRHFDIKFWVLVHAGRVYMHQNAEVVLSPREVFNGTVRPRGFDQQKSHHSLMRRDCLHSFLSNKSTGKEKGWLEAIHAKLVAALPIMEPVIHATTTENDGKLYHIFRSSAMIRENGEALITGFSEWPICDWDDTGYNHTFDCDGDETTSELSVEERKAGYETSVSTMFGDFYAIALGLGNTTFLSDDTNSCFLFDGRVREVIGFQSPNHMTQSR